MRIKSVHHKRRTALDLLLAFLLLLALVGILFTEVARSASAISRERAVLTDYTVTEAREGYLFRNEEVLYNSNIGAIDYTVTDAASVAAGSVVANVYTADTGAGERVKAAALYDEIRLLEKALAESDTAWQLAYLAAWGSASDALSAGNYRGGEYAAKALADALLYRDAGSGEAARAAVEARIAACRAELELLLRYEQSLPTRAAMDGAFYGTVDGLEPIFGLESVAGLTPEGLTQKLAAVLPQPDGMKPIGKIVATGEVYIAVPLSAADAATYTAGNTYRVRLTRYGETLEMTLSRISTSADGRSALLILYGNDLPILADAVRRQEIEIERETVTGLALPLAALQKNGDREVVFVERDGKAVMREIRVLYRAGGVLLVAPDAGEGYLATGDHVLVTERSLYEGRVVR